MTPCGCPLQGKPSPPWSSAGSLGACLSEGTEVGCVLAPMPRTVGATLQPLSPWGGVGASPTCHGATVCPAGQQGQGWLTEGVELRDAGALLLGLRGGLAYLTLEGGEEVLAKLFGHICLQVGLHEEAKALVVNGLGRGQRRMTEVPWEHHGGAELPAEGARPVPWVPLTGHISCRALPKTAGFPNPSDGI